MDLPDDAPLAMAAAAGAHSEVDVMVAKLLRPLPSSEEEKQEAKEEEPPSLPVSGSADGVGSPSGSGAVREEEVREHQGQEPPGRMGDLAWERLPALLRSALGEVYPSSLCLQAAFEGVEGARELLRELPAGALVPGEIEGLAEELSRWHQCGAGAFKRRRQELAGQAVWSQLHAPLSRRSAEEAMGEARAAELDVARYVRPAAWRTSLGRKLAGAPDAPTRLALEKVEHARWAAKLAAGSRRPVCRRRRLLPARRSQRSRAYGSSAPGGRGR